MKKLCKKGKVHPSPPLISDHLAFLPATILTLTAALSLQDREVLAYLLSCSGSGSPTTKKTQKSSFNGGAASATEHSPLFYCNCFRCYTSYWVRWDASPNRQLIHDIIDAFEDELTQKKKKMKNKKGKKKKGGSDCDCSINESNRGNSNNNNPGESESVVASSPCDGGSSSCSGDDGEEREDYEKGSVRKFVTFIGETIWGAWN